MDPWLLAGILYLGAGVGLALVQLGRPLIGLPNPEAALQKSDLPWLAAVVTFGGMFGPLLLMLGLFRTSGSTGALLLNLEGLATMAIAWIVFRENVDRPLLLGASAILTEPHSHWRRHEPMRHRHPQYPDLHHRDSHPDAVP